MFNAVPVDNQPISAGFFGQGHWLTDYITPSDIEVETLYKTLTEGVSDQEQRLYKLWAWVASQVRYKDFIHAQLTVEGKTSTQPDVWNMPGLTKKIQVGNCANKAFLMTSLVRRELPADQVYCVLGNLHNGSVGGHAWTQVTLNSRQYVMETTRPDVSPFVPAEAAERYEPVHYFNDQQVWAVPGKTVMEPFSACYSEWLHSYLNWAYINSQGRR